MTSLTLDTVAALAPTAALAGQWLWARLRNQPSWLGRVYGFGLQQASLRWAADQKDRRIAALEAMVTATERDRDWWRKRAEAGATSESADGLLGIPAPTPTRSKRKRTRSSPTPSAPSGRTTRSGRTTSPISSPTPGGDSTRRKASRDDDAHR